MSARTPLVSVTLPAYNNGSQIADAVDSVLRQTFRDLELVIVDDGSVDDTVDVVRRFDDPRIVLFTQRNHGAAHATNVAVRAARGRYVALFAGDDICHPERLERELQHLERTGGPIVFSWAAFIDDNREPLTGEHFAQHWFNHPHRTRAEMLAWFFFNGNYLCTPSCLVERQLLLDAGLFPTTCAQLPDFAMWVTLIRRHELALIQEPLLEYRVHADGRNVSAPANAGRAYFELCQLYRHVFDEVPIELFREAFADRLRHRDCAPGPAHELEKAFLYLQHNVPSVRVLGVERLWQALQDPAHLAVAEERYGFSLPQFLLLTTTMDVMGAVEHLDLQQWASSVDGERKALRTAVEQTEAEYRKLEAYTKHVLAVKDEIQAELQRHIDARGAG